MPDELLVVVVAVARLGALALVRGRLPIGVPGLVFPIHEAQATGGLAISQID